MLRTFLGKLRSSTPGRRHKWFIRNFPSIQYLWVVEILKAPSSVQGMEIKTKRERDHNCSCITQLSFTESLPSSCAGLTTFTVPIRYGYASLSLTFSSLYCLFLDRKGLVNLASFRNFLKLIWVLSLMSFPWRIRYSVLDETAMQHTYTQII